MKAIKFFYYLSCVIVYIAVMTIITVYLIDGKLTTKGQLIFGFSTIFFCIILNAIFIPWIIEEYKHIRNTRRIQGEGIRRLLKAKYYDPYEYIDS